MKLRKPFRLSEFFKFLHLYRTAFPRAERKSLAMLLRAKRHGAELLGIFDDSETFCGIAILHHGDTLSLLEYFAISPKKRGGGIGKQALSLLINHCGANRFLLEIEQCDAPCENKEQRLRRRRFYLASDLRSDGVLVLQNGVFLELLCRGGQVSFYEYHALLAKVYGRRIADKTSLLSENYQPKL